MYRMGALDSAQFYSSHEKKQLSSIKMQQENLADIKHKLSIIYKHIQSMQKDMQYLKKLSKIKNKNSASSPPIILFFIFFMFYMLKKKKTKKKTTKTCLWRKEIISSPSM
jgi:predicted PurR-regulated permease PerM